MTGPDDPEGPQGSDGPDGPDGSEEPDEPDEADEADEAADDGDAVRRPARPAAASGSVAATVVIVLLLAVVGGGLLLLKNTGDQPPAAEPTLGGQTTVPSEPTEGFTPTRDESLPPLPEGVPTELCPRLAQAEPLTALSFNIHSALGPGGFSLQRIADEITSWKADIVFLQEVDSGRPRSGRIAQAEWLGRETGMQAVYAGVAATDAGGGQIGNAILSRFEVKDSASLALPQAGGKFPRGAVHAVLDVYGADVSVYGTHWDHRTSGARVAQARYLADRIRDDDLPTLIAGDFNAGPTSAPLQTIRSAGLGDVWAVGEGSGATVPAGAPRARIDFVLHDGWFSPLQATVLRSAVSDHRAVWARLEFRKELPCIKVGDGGR